MKKLFIATVLTTTLFASPSFAVEPIYNVQDHYTTQNQQIPSTQNVCRNVSVPVYGNTGRGASGGDVLLGMGLGALVGKAVSGKRDGAYVGGALGGIIAAEEASNRRGVVDYQIEQRCNRQTTYTTSSNRVYSHTTATIFIDGRSYPVRFNRYNR
jgi:hypothetical protein